MPSFTCSLCCSWQLEEDCRILPRPPCTVHEWDKTPYDGALPRGPCTRATRPVASGLRGIPAARCEFRWHCFRYHRHPVQAAGVSAKPGVSKARSRAPISCASATRSGKARLLPLSQGCHLPDLTTKVSIKELPHRRGSPRLSPSGHSPPTRATARRLESHVLPPHRCAESHGGAWDESCAGSRG